MIIRSLVTIIAVASCTACANQLSPAETSVSILVFGDTGYDYDWLDEDDYEERFTGREFIVNELDDWIEDKRPIEEFRIPPMHYAEQTGGYVMASGMWPVSQAARAWCEPPERCHFGIMAGDNIYPSGATAGADGRDDNERFDQLLWKPYKGLREQDPGFVIYPVLGNHDWDTSREGAMAQIEWLKASPLYDLDGVYYRRMAARDVEVFAIDTTLLLNAEIVYEDALADDGSPIHTGEEDKDEPWAEPVGDEADMLSWLEAALAESQARWKIVVAHHPLWSSSGTKHEEARVLRRLLMPMLCRYADAYFAGHDHTLEVHTDDCSSAGEHFRELPPLLHLVSGAAGKQRPIHSLFMDWQDRHSPQKQTWYAEGLIWGFMEVVLAGDTASVQVVTTPADGSGKPVPAYFREFGRRSGRLGSAE